jgi:Fe-S cluster assembly protein SufD
MAQARQPAAALPTPALDTPLAVWLQAAQDFAATQPNAQPWVAALRAAGRQEATKLGWPRKRDEAFAHTSLAAYGAAAQVGPSAASTDAATAGAASIAAASSAAELNQAALPAPLCQGSHQIVLLDGRYHPQLGARGANGALAADAVRITALEEILGHPDSSTRPLLAAGAMPSEITCCGLLPALNDAFVQHGVIVEVMAEASIKEAIEIVWVSTEGTAGVSHSRTVIHLGRQARATVLERFVSLKDSNFQVQSGAVKTSSNNSTRVCNTVTQIDLDPGAHLHHAVVQELSDDVQLYSHTETTVGADAQLHDFLLCSGAQSARHQSRVQLQGRGAAADLSGLYLGRGKQQHSVNLQVVHAQPHGSSAQAFKGILDDAATGIFSGTVFVRPHAIKSAAKQLNKNLLLSKQAAAHTRPRLEILTDDVTCTHGATVGQLDEQALFYLRSRGLSVQEAQQLLTYAFGGDVLLQVQDQALRAALQARLQAWLRVPAAIGG